MTGGIPIARLFGIEIRVSLTLAMLVAIVVLIGASEAALVDPAIPEPLQWLIGGGVAIGFLASVIAHELAHAIVGRRRGVAVGAVVLGFIGGLAPMAIEARRPRDELAIALAGPAVSLGVALVAVPLAVGLGAGVPGLRPAAGGLLVVGGLNLVLGILSLLPGLPLDGGRAVRAIAWERTGDPDRAGHVTARVGLLLGWATIGVGIALLFLSLDNVSVGLLFVALGWLLSGGSRTLERRLMLERVLRGATVDDALLRDVPRVSPHLTIDTFADRFAGPDAVLAVPVVDGDEVVGVVGVRRLRRLGGRRFGTTRAADLMVSPPLAPILAPGDALWDAIELLSRRGLDGLAVVEDGLLAGMLTLDSAGVAIRARVPESMLGGRGRGTGRGR
jgi:Zn-dependent protease